MYILCNDKNHYVGGTKSGQDFLSSFGRFLFDLHKARYVTCTCTVVRKIAALMNSLLQVLKGDSHPKNEKLFISWIL